MKLLRALIARIDSWARFPEFEHLDDMYDVWGDVTDPERPVNPVHGPNGGER